MNNECIEWSGSYFNHGYGRVCVGHQKVALAHRVAYCDAHGLALDDIEGQMVCHKCNNKRCVNTNHLYLGDSQSNMDDRKASGHYEVKITDDQVEEIRSRYLRGSKDNGQQTLADEFGVSRSYISYLISGKKR